jgi:hypothetical protein
VCTLKITSLYWITKKRGGEREKSSSEEKKICII